MRRNAIYTTLVSLVLLLSTAPMATRAETQCSDLFADARPSSTDKLRQDGIALVRRQRELLNKLFKTTGYANREELTKAIENLKGDSAVVRDLILKEQVAVGLGAPSDYRSSILTRGFLNQHETGTSNVIYSPNFRNYSEASQLSIVPNTDYRSMDPGLKAKYAMLEPTSGSTFVRRHNIYGDDLFYFDLAKIRHRMTWTPGDSLYRAKGYEPRAWDQLFLSWEDRMLLIPILLNNGCQPGSILRFEAVAFHSYPEVFPIKTTQEPLDYVEIQIWGPLTLDDVLIFEYKQLPPKGDFLRELQMRGIEIRDGREK